MKTVIHLDDVLMLGKFEETCLRISKEVTLMINIGETRRTEQQGETLNFVGKPIIMTETGFKIQGCSTIFDATIAWDRPDIQCATLIASNCMLQADDFRHDEGEANCALLDTPSRTLVVL